MPALCQTQGVVWATNRPCAVRRPKKAITKSRQKPLKTAFGGFFGAPEGIRIPGLPLRRRTLYPAELRAHTTPGISVNEYARCVVPVVGLEPTRCCHQRILSPHRLPFRHTGVRIAFILYYAAFVKSSVFCPQNAKKTISGLFSARRRAGLCRRGALPVSAVQRDSRRGLPVSAAQRDSRRGLPQQASHC